MTQPISIETEAAEFHPQFKKNLWINILMGMALGIALGLALSPHGFALVDKEVSFLLASWIKLPGTFFLGMIQMVVIPLVLCSIILGITQSGELGFLKKMGVRIILYFVVTTTLAISIGLAWVSIIQPGNYIDPSLIESFRQEQPMKTAGQTSENIEMLQNLTVPERISNLIPVNIPHAVVERNLLQIVIAAMVIGIAIVSLPSNVTKPITDLCVSGQAIAMTVIGWAMVIAPYAVFGLLCDITIKLGFGALAGMGMYMATVILGLLSVACMYLVIASVIGRKNPFEFLRSIRETQLLAFSTSSSAATMPFTLSCAEEKLGVSPKISRFVVPLGATINMDGTALYQAVAALFLVQVFGAVSGVELSTTDVVLLMITTVGASIGTPAMPGVGIIVLSTILVGIGIHPAAVGFILGVDRILDMCRTTVNVTGDLTATVVMERWLNKEK
ncbi:MAG: dicarboxylate/amino acid:cation symporter [Alphaproteobacteria bacterium]